MPVCMFERSTLTVELHAKIMPVHPPPPYVQQLFLGCSLESKAFKKQARVFNNKLSFAFVSMHNNIRGSMHYIHSNIIIIVLNSSPKKLLCIIMLP